MKYFIQFPKRDLKKKEKEKKCFHGEKSLRRFKQIIPCCALIFVGTGIDSSIRPCWTVKSEILSPTHRMQFGIPATRRQ